MRRQFYLRVSVEHCAPSNLYLQPKLKRLIAYSATCECIPMPPELDRYRKHVEHFDLTDMEKNALIHTVYSAMESFADRAFRSDPVQLCIDLKASKDASSDGDVIDLEKSEYQNLTQVFNVPKGDV